MIYVGIVGTRRHDTIGDLTTVRNALLNIYGPDSMLLATLKGKGPGLTIVSGGCPKGADRFAEILAAAYGALTIIHYPKQSELDSVLLKKNPRAAWAKINYARNTMIARDAKDYLIACVATDRKGGTEHTIKEWKRLHKDLPSERLIIV